jgi:outer membrane usher protein
VLVLEVILNGRATGVLSDMTERDGVLMATPTELGDLGFRVPEKFQGTTDLIAVNELPGVEARVNEQTQTIIIKADDSALRPQEINGPRDFGSTTKVTRPAMALALNYSLLGTLTQGRTSGGGQGDARISSPYGTFSTSGQGLFASVPGQSPVVRLDSSWTYADPDKLRRFIVGDLITGALASSRPLRLGGIQIVSDFSFRPDLITFPLPQLSGSTAVPTTVDVLVNGVRQLSQPVTPGPFEIRSLPIVTGAGEVAIAYQDSLGRQVITQVPFYSSSALLASGLTTYSIEAGFLREDYSQLSNQYGQVVFVGTGRHGLTDWLTLEGHAEGASDLGMASLGGNLRVGTLGIFSFNQAASISAGQSGWMSSVSLERSARDYNIAVSGTLASRGFQDIAGITGSPLPQTTFRVSGGIPLGSLGSLGVAYIRQLPFGTQAGSKGAGGAAISLATMSYQLQLLEKVNLYATGYVNPRATDPATGRPALGYGAMLGISINLGGNYGVDASASDDMGKASYVVQARKSGSENGEFGVNLIDSEGFAKRRLGEFQYNDPAGVVTLGVDEAPGATSYRAGLDGSLVVGGGSVFAARTIDDSFAIVRTGDVSGVGVSYENRPIGATDSAGELLIPDLRAYQSNRITLTATDLPPDVTAGSTEQFIRPPEKSGIIVDFEVKGSHAALVRLTDSQGHVMPVGAIAQQGGADKFIVGYDGEVYMTDLEDQNSFSMLLPDGTHCDIAFPYHHVQGELATIGPFKCQ